MSVQINQTWALMFTTKLLIFRSVILPTKTVMVSD